MSISRVSTLTLHRQTLSDVLNVQSDLAKLQNQISSGLKANTFAELHGQVETFVQLEAKMQKSQNYIDNNTIIESRMQTTSVTMDQIINIADDYKNLLLQRRNGATGQDVQFQISARAMLDMVADELNTSIEGRYLFSGGRTNGPAVMTPVPAPFIAGVPDQSYYLGDSQDLTARVEDHMEIAYNVRANDPAFQKLFAAINLGLSADLTDSQTLLADATEMIAGAIDDLTGVRARVQQNTVNITQVSERHEQLKLYWKGITERISKTDLLSASTEVSTDQAILQASFQAFSVISQLKLTDYIR